MILAERVLRGSTVGALARAFPQVTQHVQTGHEAGGRGPEEPEPVLCPDSR